MLISSYKFDRVFTGVLSGMLTNPVYLSPDEDLFVECWTCSKRRMLDSSVYKVGKKFDFRQSVKEVGFSPVVDFANRRILAFCSDECDESSRRGDGMYLVVRPSAL